jgi:uncharacterized membrane protein YfcA
MLLALTLGAGIGLALGLLGGGGSVITVPVLVYAAGIDPAAAVAMSLAVVGGTSMVGAWFKHREQLVHKQATLMFGGVGMLGAWAGAHLTPMVSPQTLLVLFALLMVVIATIMLLRREEELTPKPECRPVRCLFSGLGVGLLTGFLGVGGGFLLVPAMVIFARLPMKMAIGTSLAVIAINSLAGLIGHGRQAAVDWPLTGAFLVVAILGMLAGNHLASRVPVARLQRGFAGFVLAVAALLLIKNLI